MNDKTEQEVELRMDAYYYGFDKTHCPEVDKVLSAVAWAGKAFHQTQDWIEDCEPRESHTGETPQQWIQNAAIECAAAIGRLKIELANAQQAAQPQEAEPVADCVTVQSGPINWLKEKFPDLCIKAGLCEKIGGRLYTKTVRPIPKPAARPIEPSPQHVLDYGYHELFWAIAAAVAETQPGVPRVISVKAFKEKLLSTANNKPQPVASSPQGLEDDFRNQLDQLSQRNYELRMENANLRTLMAGKALVPVEPTYEMCRAGGFPWENPPFPERYKAMLKAAP